MFYKTHFRVGRAQDLKDQGIRGALFCSDPRGMVSKGGSCLMADVLSFLTHCGGGVGGGGGGAGMRGRAGAGVSFKTGGGEGGGA